ncbi:MAG: hypothetical protein ABJC79_13660 [Acidimicrobiia bacterium]
MLAGWRTTIAIGLVAVVLIALGVWRHAQLVDDRDAARVRRVEAIHELHRLRQNLVAASLATGTVERQTIDSRHASEELVTLAEEVSGQIHGVERERDDAVLSAFVAGGQIGRLRECLDGINRALNQISVGDPNGPNTLNSVGDACRAVGA